MMRKKEYVPNLHRRKCPEEGDRFTYRDYDTFEEHEAIALVRRGVAGRWGVDAMHADGFIRYVWDGQVTLVHEKE